MTQSFSHCSSWLSQNECTKRSCEWGPNPYYPRMKVCGPPSASFRQAKVPSPKSISGRRSVSRVNRNLRQKHKQYSKCAAYWNNKDMCEENKCHWDEKKGCFPTYQQASKFPSIKSPKKKSRSPVDARSSPKKTTVRQTQINKRKQRQKYSQCAKYISKDLCPADSCKWVKNKGCFRSSQQASKFPSIKSPKKKSPRRRSPSKSPINKRKRRQQYSKCARYIVPKTCRDSRFECGWIQNKGCFPKKDLSAVKKQRPQMRYPHRVRRQKRIVLEQTPKKQKRQKYSQCRRWISKRNCENRDCLWIPGEGCI